MNSFKEMATTSEKITLKNPVTLDELFGLMTAAETTFPGKFKLASGLFGKSIAFDVYQNVKVKVTVKENVVKVSRSNSSAKVGGIDVKATAQRIDAMKEGGVGKALTGGLDYFKNVRESMKALLADRI